MRLAIISDIHSNLEALKKALELIDKHSIDEIVCLGDVIGYGANPNECMELVQRRCNIIVKGNHEEAVININTADDFTDNARSAIVWTRKNLSSEHLEFIKSLPLVYSIENILFVHASPCKPAEWRYIFDDEEAAQSFRCFSEPLCFVGHTHMPMLFSPDGWADRVTKSERFIINVGSIGQPRDRNIQLSFGVLDTDTWTYENIRSPYDVETAASKILKTDLPPKLGHRLLIGV
jgi:diadenosine tetraphosphatase ApaH/serine/threonine PP2A family protein phosphatase